MPELTEALVVRPGDKLIVRIWEDISMERGVELRAEIEERLPGVEVVIIVAQQIAVYRPEVADVG